MGGIFYNDIPEAPDSLTIQADTSQGTITLKWKNPTRTVYGNALDSLSAIRIFRNDSLIAELNLTDESYDSSYTDVIPQGDFYRYGVCAVDGNSIPGRIIYGCEKWYGDPIHGIVIWDLDVTPITGQALVEGIRATGYNAPIYLSHTSARYPLTQDVQAVFVCLGMYSNNHQLTDEEGLKLKNYLDQGGRVYMEGGDTWCYDPQTVVHPYFHILPIGDGSSDLTAVVGDTGTFCDGLFFNYQGENSWVDRIAPSGTSQRILHNLNTLHGVAVAYDGGSYKTIGASCELGGLVGNTPNSTRNELIRRILLFFDVISPNNISGNSASSLPQEFLLQSNYPNPFNNRTVFTFALPWNGDVELQIFNVAGQKIYQVERKGLPAGWHRMSWEGIDSRSRPVASGLYFYRFTAYSSRGKQMVRTGKMQLVK